MKLIITDFEKNSKRIKLKIPYQAFEWRKLIKSFTGSFYHPNQKLWSIPNTKENLYKVERYFGKSIEYVAKNKTPKRPFIELNREILRMMEFAETKLILSGKAVSTQKQYKGELLRYFKNFEGRKMQEVSKEEIETYVYKLKKNYDISDSKQNIIINAIKFYHEKVLEQDRTYYNITRPKKDKILPGVLSENEVMKLLESTLNIKHKTILTVMYGSGLRISEVVNLRIQDIKSDNMQIFVKSSKGDKDRMTPLSKHCLILLRDY